MNLIADIVVNIPSIKDSFHYSIPQDLIEGIIPGQLVKVPFGKQELLGIVFSTCEKSLEFETKSILEIIDPKPVLTPPQLTLATRISHASYNSMAAVVSMMLPPGIAKQADYLYSISRREESSTWSTTQQRLYKLLDKRGSLRGRQIDRSFAKHEWRKSAQGLLKAGVINTQPVLPPPSVKPKMIRMAQLSVAPQQAQEAMVSLGKTPVTQRRRQIALEFLIREPTPVNVSWIYAESGCNLSDLQELAEKDLIVLFETEIWRDPLSDHTSGTSSAPVLTESQVEVWKKIQNGMALQMNGNEIEPYLLHGVTGSGKTEIYLHAVAETIKQGKQAIVLVPEISLTPQTVKRFLARFPGQVGLVHSKLSEGERYDTWRRARLGLLNIIIGPRSALFAPLPDIGLIILDECHDGSYYQSETPSYDVVRTAIDYSRTLNAVCIFGSATPQVSLMYQSKTSQDDRYKSKSPRIQLLELPGRITPLEKGGVDEGTPLPPVKIIDMRDELKSGNRSFFSRELENSLSAVLSRDEQAIIFLNRRGSATYVFCRNCGSSIVCPRCEIPLTFHTQLPGIELLCHHCGYSRKSPKICPVCKSDSIRQYGLGSERVATEIQERFAEARVIRWDWETTRQKNSHEVILSHFISQRANVLVGTQMLAKGLDLPKVTLVGIVLADVGLNFPDPFAAERVFQVLTQVAGRAGRSSLGGKVILQTFQPDNYVIQAASRHDYKGFYDQEIVERRRLGFPPFNQLVRLQYHHFDAPLAESRIQEMARKIETRRVELGLVETDYIGPVPCYFAKINNAYRWQLILRGPDPSVLIPANLPEGWQVEINPPVLL